MPDFTTLTIRGVGCVTDTSSGAIVFHAVDPHALIQAAGYLKHRCGATENIFFRGQSRLYPTFTPTLFRGRTSVRAQAKAVSDMRTMIDTAVSGASLFKAFDPVFYEPLFQHYGLRTTWLDLVDNIWVALWFACHNALSSSKTPQYLHFEKRNAHKEAHPSYVYILMVGTDRVQTALPGFFKGSNTEMVDLRIGCPSIFLRPHTQHGVLFRRVGGPFSRPSDCSNCIRGIIRADLQEALSWLGQGDLLNTHSLMPPPFYDHGYRILLDLELPPTLRAGAIQHIGA